MRRNIAQPFVQIAMLVVLSVAVSAEQKQRSADSAPSPLPENPSVTYPLVAWQELVEGPVRFRALISEEGRVLQVEILDVPREGVGFEDSVRETLADWRFEPARLDGRPVRQFYEGEFDFILTFPESHGRMYGVSSDALWGAMEELLAELGIKSTKRLESDGVIITRAISVSPKRLPGLTPFEEPPGFVPQQVQLHIFIPRVAEPGRLYIGSMLQSKRRPSGRRHTVYNAGIVESWLYEKLEDRLQQRGHALPRSPSKRRALAERLLGTELEPACRADELLLAGVGEVKNPDLIQATKLRPLYPGDAIVAREEAGVALQAVVYEDGWVGDIQFVGDRNDDPEFETSAAHTVSFWRYRPATRGGCGVAIWITVFVQFRMR